MTTTTVAGSPVALADGAADADAVLPLEPLLFFLLLELEQPPPLLLLLLLPELFPPLLPPLPPLDEKPVSANTTVTSTAVNLM
ncbi:hypothetical protein ACFWP3_23335 [Streptomyces sp. NPDC058525]|uniref:hypothetical protein n=1 Tax=unclassified Streptomyces TaxID=2593676 RepID=UPI00366A2C99